MRGHDAQGPPDPSGDLQAERLRAEKWERGRRLLDRLSAKVADSSPTGLLLSRFLKSYMALFISYIALPFLSVV